MNLRLVNGFNQESDAGLSTRASQIVIAMTDNPNFTTPTPSVADVSEILGAYNTALGNCTEGDRQKIALKNQMRETLIEVLHVWGLYVVLNCGNDIAVALTSGFKVAKAPSPAPPLGKPSVPVIDFGINRGDMISKGKREAQALVYLHQYATEAEMQAGKWQTEHSSKSTAVISGLVPGTNYYYRIGIVGRKNQIVYSDVTSRIAA